MFLGAIGGVNPLAMLGGMAATKAVDAVTSLFVPKQAPAQKGGELQSLQFAQDAQQPLHDSAGIEDAAKMRLAWVSEQNPADLDAQRRAHLEETLRKKTEDHVRAMTGKTAGGLVNLVA